MKLKLRKFQALDVAVADPVVTPPPPAFASFVEFALASELPPVPFRLRFALSLFEALPPKALFAPVVAFVATVFEMSELFEEDTRTSLVFVLVVELSVVTLFVSV